jgi:threonylcarbamoyladenosine tRNA methylthiotransferase MtaB
MKKAVVFNLGCKVNQYECDVLAGGLKAMGYITSERLEQADVYIVNTCAVTAEAERKSRQILSRIRKQNPDAYIAVCGCASQKNADFFIENGVELVFGVAGKDKLLERIGTRYAEIAPLPLFYESSGYLPLGTRTRAYVKIQDGCDNFCSYCIIPYLRGLPRSKRVAEAASEIRALASRTNEIVITGINLSRYGKDTGESLAALIREIRDVPARIRLGSFYVEGMNEELLEALFSLKNFCPHFHLSLQHGDNEVLRTMNRRYTSEDYLAKVGLIRSHDPFAAITTDVIVGFPTETEEAFCNLLEFVNEARFSDIHIFPYSRREGTAAAKYPALAPEVVKARAKRLEQVKKELRKEYLQRHIGVPQEVVPEEKKGTFAEGYSQYYVRCYWQQDDSLQEKAVLIPQGLFSDGLKCVISRK